MVGDRMCIRRVIHHSVVYYIPVAVKDHKYAPCSERWPNLPCGGGGILNIHWYRGDRD